ncbi:MAG TPA: fasciclin domain-containing protein [Anditalea sp.]|nr:fasciclin domain-containing protein [Anditalea sp.]
MKNINKNLKYVTAMLAFMLIGLNVTFAQEHVTDELLRDNRDRDDLNYEEMFDGATESQDVFAMIKSDDNFSKFVELVEKSGLAPSMKAAGEYTIFIPTNDAFKELTVRQYETLTKPENKDMLTRVIKAHIFPSKVGMTNFTGRQTMETSDGIEIPIETVGSDAAATTGPGSVTVGGARIMRSDVQASNGVIHVIDRVIIPGQTSSTAGFGVSR